MNTIEGIAINAAAQDERILGVVARHMAPQLGARLAICSFGDGGNHGYFDDDSNPQSYFGPGQAPGSAPLRPS